MIRRWPRLFAAGLAAGLAVTLAGCGVPAETEPRHVAPPRGAPLATVSPVSPQTQPGAVVQRVYFVRDDHLVPAARWVRTEPTAHAHLELLLSGPTEAEGDSGLTSAVAGTDMVVGLRVEGGEARVEIGDGLAGTGRNDEILAFGQIVCTLTGRNDINRVTFWHQGDRVGIPRGDGSLSDLPLTSSDYTALVTG